MFFYHLIKIANWNASGKLFYDFINVDNEVTNLIQQQDDENLGFKIEEVMLKKISKLESCP
jgi:hypothetical protein